MPENPFELEKMSIRILLLRLHAIPKLSEMTDFTPTNNADCESCDLATNLPRKFLEVSAVLTRL